MIGMPLLAQAGLVTWDTVVRTLLFLPALMAGIWLGARSFKSADPTTFRKWVLVILAMLAALTSVRGMTGL